jgi:hypothetical protein
MGPIQRMPFEVVRRVTALGMYQDFCTMFIVQIFSSSSDTIVNLFFPFFYVALLLTFWNQSSMAMEFR